MAGMIVRAAEVMLEEVLEKVGLSEGDVERALEWVSILR
jgi:hypothetical protein